MNYAIKILSLADTDAVDAALWYDAQSNGLGAEFLAEVNAATKRLTLNPEIHRVRFADVRRIGLKRFKFYGLYYLIQATEVWVIAIHHGRRHPRWLKERRKNLN